MKKSANKELWKNDGILRLKYLKSTIKYKEDIKILALDPATEMGWAFSLSENGVVKFNKKDKEFIGLRWQMLEKWLDTYAKEFDVIVAEMPVVKHAGAVIHHSKMVGIIQLFCQKNGIAYEEFDPKTIKQFACGTALASKEDMIESLERHTGIKESNNNIVDAVWIYLYYKFTKYVKDL